MAFWLAILDVCTSENSETGVDQIFPGFLHQTHFLLYKAGVRKHFWNKAKSVRLQKVNADACL